MTEQLSEPWDAYLRLQSDLDATCQVSDWSWGLEAGLDAILAAVDKHEVKSEPTDLKTIVASARRRERHRSRQRHIFAADLAPVPDEPARCDAHILLGHMRRISAIRDWQLISGVGVGMEYKAIAQMFGGTPGGLRVRMLRIRRDMRSLTMQPNGGSRMAGRSSLSRLLLSRRRS